MKRTLSILIPLLLLLSLLGCTRANTALEPLISSYYAGQGERAYEMFQKSIFRNMAEGWTGVKNASWDYATFAAYELPDASGDTALYTCAYTAGQGQCGFAVVRYNGNSLQKLSVQQTPYLFDLEANLKEIGSALSDTPLELSSAAARRVRLADAREGIRITDGKGRTFLFAFEESGVFPAFAPSNRN